MKTWLKAGLIGVIAGAIGGGTGPYVAELFNGGKLCVGLSAAFIAIVIALILSLILKDK